MRQHDLPDRGRVVLGRGQECDVQIDHTSVSRRHTALQVDGDDFKIEDLGSSNGTRVDGRKLDPGATVSVASGSQIKLGATTLILPRPGAAEAAADASGAAAAASSPAMQAVFAQLDLVAQGKIAVLIRGETGVGKGLVARELHRRSPRAAGPFVSLSCAALCEAVLESELFGFERGALPGATEAKAGLVEATDGGTFFLDEIGELAPSTQGKLLRVLESGEVARIGGVQPRRVDVRFVSATNQDLDALVAKGTLRSDLYFRLAGAKLLIPPLRERRGEIPALAAQFVAAAAADVRRPAAQLSQGALAALVRHEWPGNVRELKHVIERAVLLARGVIQPEHLALETPPAHGAPTLLPPAGADGVGAGEHGLRAQLSAVERDRILAALAQCEGNQSRAAKLLGISRRTPYADYPPRAVPAPTAAEAP
jgi:transcriptional regulator with GAF, ATPase, and Fis domain